MGEAVGQFLSHAVGVAISPLALVAVIAILTAPRGRANALWFALGWILAVVAVFAALLVVGASTGARHDGHPGTWVSWFRLVLGVLLALMALRQLRLAAAAEEGALPPRLRNLEQFTPANCLTLGIVLALANPKNITQIATGAVGVASEITRTSGRITAEAIFVAIASLGVLIPLLVHFSGHPTAHHTLQRWKDWTIRNHYAIMAVLFILLSAKTLGDGISGLL
ncbi:GAP family protein [Nocardia sp. CDC153]|uniref:GAP family protein n=1 Tax=Nocardia sp. CDC153 TaxID=3112167 RepID=UPI002DB8F115|nr:GAP family protein [Nocardia sp. CDC153]MEC3952896.1 GAP family protein [Nocardia sp. CDC153]